jgi:hypothetical protein
LAAKTPGRNRWATANPPRQAQSYRIKKARCGARFFIVKYYRNKPVVVLRRLSGLHQTRFSQPIVTFNSIGENASHIAASRFGFRVNFVTEHDIP